jgi:hypothetical protein
MSLMDTLDKVTHHQAFPSPDRTRYPMHFFDHLVKYPEFDVEKMQDRDLAKAVVAHLGCHSAIGGPHGKRLVLTKDTRMTRHFRTESIPFLMKEFHDGALRATTTVVNALFNCIAPDPYQECVDRCKALPSVQHMDTVPIGEAFTFRSILANVSTQEHIDSSDAIGEFTVPMPVGRFTGKRSS